MRAQGSSLRLRCRTVGVSRAGCDTRQGRQRAAQPPPRAQRDDEGLAQRSRSVVDRDERFGYRRAWAWWRCKAGRRIHPKAVPRLMPLQGGPCRLWHRPVQRPHPTWATRATADQPDRLWAADATKIWWGRDGWAPLVGGLAAGRRAGVGSRFAQEGRAREAVDALEPGGLHRDGRFTTRPPDLHVRHDNGALFLAQHVVTTTRRWGLTQECIPRRSPEDNGVVERCFRTLTQAGVWLHQLASCEAAEPVIIAWIAHDNAERQHAALG